MMCTSVTSLWISLVSFSTFDLLFQLAASRSLYFHIEDANFSEQDFSDLLPVCWDSCFKLVEDVQEFDSKVSDRLLFFHFILRDQWNPWMGFRLPYLSNYKTKLALSLSILILFCALIAISMIWFCLSLVSLLWYHYSLVSLNSSVIHSKHQSFYI